MTDLTRPEHPDLLTDTERTEAADQLSAEELRFIVAGLINVDGGLFDALLTASQLIEEAS